jgi:hypothetical protein
MRRSVIVVVRTLISGRMKTFKARLKLGSFNHLFCHRVEQPSRGLPFDDAARAASEEEDTVPMPLLDIAELG